MKETRHLHRFQPQGKLLVYNTSLQASPPTEGIIVKSISLSRVQIEDNTLQISSFVACTYNEKWGLGMVAQISYEFTLEKEVSECLLPYSDSRQYVGQYVRDLWQREWDLAVHHKLHAIKPTIGGQSFTYRSRKEQVILDRLRIGHTRLTHSFLLKGEPPPECTTCECQLTIQHILFDCIEYDFIRPELFGNNTTF